MPHFVLVVRGIYSTEASNQSRLCSSSTLIFNPSGTTHRDCFRSPRGKFVSISPGIDASKFLDRASPQARVVAGEPARSTEGMRIVREILREFGGRKHPSAVILEGLGLELLGHLMEGSRTESRYIPDWLLRTKEMMEDCAGHDLSIAELAATALVHPVYLARAFRKYFGYSPSEYLQRNRLLRVQRLLAETRLPLTDVALQCGFSDQSRMTHAFSGQFGIAPGQFRRRHTILNRE